MSSNPNPSFDERQWIINIRHTLKAELENETDFPACIFNVTKTLMSTDPASYTPQEVAIGPYYFWRPELYGMESYKLAAAKRAQKQLHDTFVPKAEQKAEITEVDDQGEAMQPEEIHSDYTKRLISQLWKLLLSRVNKGPIKLIKKLVVSKPTKLLSKLPWKTFQDVVFPQQNVEKKSDDESSTSSKHMNKPPLVEEITIPSVTELAKSNVRFLPTVGNISTVRFDAKKAILHLPTISLDVNTVVVLRNVVAYEASSASGPLVLTRYTELMNGIIDTEEDAKLLREKGSDAGVANLWNGMNKSIKMTKVPRLDRVIEDVNKYYYNRWKVKFGKYMKFYVFGSWKFLTLLATIVLLLLTTLQAFCSVYNCRKFNLGSTSE
ncbi:hypothetical protein CICLE_v10027364mg [Citrus x clementina]|uniref:Uncharacterized protein n=1 Tax=Citrus clementina TaxID=85681 RepID=V4UMW1_CITCL|nr:hypothetical protein CICLE_v10027364mg [Citrus x clementina]